MTITWGACGHPLRLIDAATIYEPDGRVRVSVQPCMPYCKVCRTAEGTTEAENAFDLTQRTNPQTFVVTSVELSGVTGTTADGSEVGIDFTDVSGFVEGQAYEFSTGPTRGDIRAEWAGREEEANAWESVPTTRADNTWIVRRRFGHGMAADEDMGWVFRDLEAIGALPGHRYDPVTGEPLRARYLRGRVSVPVGLPPGTAVRLTLASGNVATLLGTDSYTLPADDTVVSVEVITPASADVITVGLDA